MASIQDIISSSGGPKTQATKADYVKFHDDKSTYTGVYAKYQPPRHCLCEGAMQFLLRTPDTPQSLAERKSGLEGLSSSKQAIQKLCKSSNCPNSTIIAGGLQTSGLCIGPQCALSAEVVQPTQMAKRICPAWLTGAQLIIVVCPQQRLQISTDPTETCRDSIHGARLPLC